MAKPSGWARPVPATAVPLIEPTGAGRKGRESAARVEQIGNVVGNAAEVFAGQFQSQLLSERLMSGKGRIVESCRRSLELRANDRAGKLGVMGPGATVEVA